MSKHAKPTLVRFFRGDEDGRYVLVKNWEVRGPGVATFTLPATSLTGRSLMNDGLCDLRVIVMESEEVEWCIHRIDRDRWPINGPYRIECQSLVARLRSGQPTDDYVLANFQVSQ